MMTQAIVIFLSILVVSTVLAMVLGKLAGLMYDAGRLDFSLFAVVVTVAVFALGVLAGWWFL